MQPMSSDPQGPQVPPDSPVCRPPPRDLQHRPQGHRPATPGAPTAASAAVDLRPTHGRTPGTHDPALHVPPLQQRDGQPEQGGLHLLRLGGGRARVAHFEVRTVRAY